MFGAIEIFFTHLIFIEPSSTGEGNIIQYRRGTMFVLPVKLRGQSEQLVAYGPF